MLETLCVKYDFVSGNLGPRSYPFMLWLETLRLPVCRRTDAAKRPAEDPSQQEDIPVFRSQMQKQNCIAITRRVSPKKHCSVVNERIYE
jgi:hypothetical protein